MSSYSFTIFAFSLLCLIPTILSLSSNCNGGACTPLSTTEKQKILDIHNELRDRIAGGGLARYGHPAATDMNSLVWDDGLENVAQSYAESCPGLNHNDNAGISYLAERDRGNVKWGPDDSSRSGSIYVGENLALQSDTLTIDYFVSRIENGWFDEYQYYTYSDDECTKGKACGHYTQMVWANTRYIGCGYANGCSGTFSSVFICNYWPAGNYNGGYKPYTEGNKCSDCMSDRTACAPSNYNSKSGSVYNALCGGGLCDTMCDGESWDRYSCDGLGCGLTKDCTDGTNGNDGGRQICSNTRPTPSPSTTTTPPPTPSGSLQCMKLSNYIYSSYKVNGVYLRNGYDNGKPAYLHETGDYEIKYNANSIPIGYILSKVAGGSTYGYCDQSDITNCGAGNWLKWARSSDDDWSLIVDSDATFTPTTCPF